MKNFSLFTVLCLLAFPTYSQLATWTFEGGVEPVPVTTTGVGITGGDAFFGDGIGNITFVTGNASTFAYSGDAWSTAALDVDDFIQVYLSSASPMSISSITFDERRSTDGPANLEVHYSRDSFETEDILITNSDIVLPADENWRTQIFDNDGVAITTTAGQTLTFRIYAYNAPAGTGTWRFDNIIIDGVNLPIELNGFTAQLQEEGIVLNWETLSELDNDYMVIERSSDGISFYEIGSVQGAGTTALPQAYSFLDETPLNGTNYYRIKQVDFDGSINFHKVIAVFSGSTAKGILSIQPNLVRNTFNLHLSEASEVDPIVSILNVNGQQLRQLVLQGSEMNHEIDISDLGIGTYFVSVKTSQGILTEKVIKQ